ncbi:MAG: hypothetical protein ACLP01_25190 [Solirubrobacteraceae bacterium]
MAISAVKLFPLPVGNATTALIFGPGKHDAAYSAVDGHTSGLSEARARTYVSNASVPGLGTPRSARD